MPFSLIQSYRNSFTGLSRETWYLSFVMLVNRSGTMVVPFMTMYLTQHMGVSIGQAGIVMVFFGAGAVSGALVGGYITDRIGFYPVQMVSLIGGGILFMVLGQITSYDWICAVTFLLSFVNESFRPANQTAIVWFSKPENRTRSYSLSRLSVNLGWAVGGALGGFLASKSYTLLFWVDGITNLLAAGLLFIMLPQTRSQPAKEQAETGTAPAATNAYYDTPFLLFILFTAIFAVCFFQVFSTLPVFYKQSWRLSETDIGYIMAFNGLMIALVEMPYVKFMEGKQHPLLLIISGVFIVAFSYISLNLLPVSIGGAFISMIFFTVGEIVGMPFMNTFWTARSQHGNRGQYASLFTTAFSIAHVTGPYCGTQVVEHYGFGVLWWIVGGVCAASAMGYYFVWKKTTADE